jgi:hypothetical protein
MLQILSNAQFIRFAGLRISGRRLEMWRSSADEPVDKCCVEAECLFHYLGDSGLYMYTKAAAWATIATVATPLPIWGEEGSGMVP